MALRQAHAVVFGVILGTGVGAGIVVNGHILTGPNGIAGEWGHNPLPWPRAARTPRPAMLLRQARLHRNLPLRAGHDASCISSRQAYR